MTDPVSNIVSLHEEKSTPEVNTKFAHCKMVEPDSVAFLSDEKGIVVAMGIIFKDKDGVETKIAMDAHIFLGWAVQMANQIGASAARAKKNGKH